MSAIRPATQMQWIAIQNAIRLLRETREYLKEADCPKTVARVRLALTSARGAERHMGHRLRRMGK